MSAPAEAAATIQELCGGDADRLFASAQGLDGRLMAALEGLGLSDAATADVLSHRCAELLAQYPTDMPHDLELLRSADTPEAMKLALRYRLSKKRILHSVADHFSQAG